MGFASVILLTANAGIPNAMPMAKAGVAPTSHVETIAYRRHGAPRYRAGRVYQRHYGVNPGAAFVGAAAGLIGAGIAASQQPAYYGYPAYGYPYGGYGYGAYGYPYGGW